MSRLFKVETYFRNKMPKLCVYENCRLRANSNSYCVFHSNITHTNVNLTCEHPHKTNLYKGCCRECFLKKFPNDPMSFQMKFRNKMIATHEYIDNHFNGFTEFQGTNNRGIHINNTLLLITCSQSKLPDIMPAKYISVLFNTDKYQCSKTGKIINPMLHKRLPLLEEIINQQIEYILDVANGTVTSPTIPFIKIDYHL